MATPGSLDEMVRTLMKAGTLLILWMAFFILSPVLYVERHFLYLPEAFLYAVFCLRRFLAFVNPPQLLQAKSGPPGAVRAHVVYAVLFFCTALLTACLASELPNNYDLLLLRNILQVVLCLKLFDDYLQEIDTCIRIDLIVFIVLLIISLPALIVYLQRSDIFSLRDIIISVYKTQFSYLGADAYKAYRYASVFKDFFTSAVYFIMLSSFIFYFTLRTTLGFAYRVALVLLLAFVYGAQFFVARSSLVMIPFLAIGIALFGVPWSMTILFKRVIPTVVLIGTATLVASQMVIESGLVKLDWALEAHSFVTSAGKDNVSSLEVMQRWYEGYFDSLYTRRTTRRDYSLLVPYHFYDITERTSVPGLYSDSFYLQEIYRYGIYGMASYLVYLFLMFTTYFSISRYVLLLVMTLAVMNIKGGNTFFMSKNIYLYAFILSVVPYIESRRL
jgi:hypothetical protein